MGNAESGSELRALLPLRVEEEGKGRSEKHLSLYHLGIGKFFGKGKQPGNEGLQEEYIEVWERKHLRGMRIFDNKAKNALFRDS